MYKVGDKVKVISRDKFNQLCGVRDYVRATKLDGIFMTKNDRKWAKIANF